MDEVVCYVFVQHVAAREVAAILGIHSQRDKVRAHAKTAQSMIVQAPEEGTDVVTAAKRVLMSSELESLGLRDKRDMSMLIAQSALQVWAPTACCGVLEWRPLMTGCLWKKVSGAVHMTVC